jgi:hypothetical protein
MKFGQYELLEPIAIGGMAEVFKGRVVAAEGFEKFVAIKRILPDLAEDERFVKMLLTEARIHSALSHRNIVQIHDLGISEDGQYFIVLEYVEGYDLRIISEQLTAEGEIIPEALSLHIASELAQGLHFAHELRGSDGQPMGLVHRDVTPSNVLISFAGEVKLSDFGLAKRRLDRSVVGSLKGNLSYMSPEQAMQAPLDRRTDVFSLGAVLFEMLTGRRLREITNEVAGWSQVASGVVPSAREIRPDLPVAIERLLDQALAFDPAQRFPDAAAFGTAIREVLGQMNVPVGASDLGALLGLVSPPRRPRILMLERSRVIRLGPEAQALREAFAAPATPAPLVSPGMTETSSGGPPPAARLARGASAASSARPAPVDDPMATPPPNTLSPPMRPRGRTPLRPAPSPVQAASDDRRPTAAPAAPIAARGSGPVPGRQTGQHAAVPRRAPMAVTPASGVRRPALARTPAVGTQRPPMGPTPAFGTQRPPFSESPPVGGQRAPMGPTPVFGTQRPAIPRTPAFGLQRPPAGVTPALGTQRPPMGVTPAFGTQRPPAGASPAFGTQRPPAGASPAFGTQRPPMGSPAFGTQRPPAGASPAFGTQRPPMGSPAFGTQRPPMGSPAFGTQRPPMGESPAFGTRRPGTVPAGAINPPFSGRGATPPSSGFHRAQRETARVQLRSRSAWRGTLMLLVLMAGGGVAAVHYFVVPLDVLLVWRKPAQLSIATEPDGASLRLDSEALAAPSPTIVSVKRDLADHVIEATLPGYRQARAIARYDKALVPSFLLRLQNDPTYVAPAAPTKAAAAANPSSPPSSTSPSPTSPSSASPSPAAGH